MSILVDQMRSAIFDVYSGYSWKDRVRNMADNQVIAVYYSFRERGVFDKPKKYSEKPNKTTKRELSRTYFEADVAEQLSFDFM